MWSTRLCAASNVQLQRSEGDTVLLIPNAFKEAVALPKVTSWKAASNKEMESLRDHKIYDLASITSVPLGPKATYSRWVYKVRVDNQLKGRGVAQA